MREQSEKFSKALNDQTDEFIKAINAQTDEFVKAINAQTDVLRAQMRANRWWAMGTMIAVGLALAALIIRMAG